MGRARRLGGGAGGTGLAIEYVRTRKVIRLLGWLAEAPIEPVEIPVDQLFRDLAISPRDIGAPQRFMLFAGSYRRPAGGLRDLVATFGDEEDAWEAFREVRQSHPSVEGWAELASMDGLGGVSQLAWFGLHTAAAGATEGGWPVHGLPREARKRPRPGTQHVDYLRAVTGQP